MHRIRKLDQQGFDHVVGIVVFVVVFAIVGTALLVYSHAQSWSGELQLGLDKNLCLDNLGGSRASGNTIDTYSCNGGTGQKWTINEMSGYTDRFTLENDQGTCADDWGDAVSSSSGNVALKTYACNSSDKAQQWEWENSELENVTSHGCINDPSNKTANGTPLIVYSCSSRSSNELWYEAAQGKNTTISSPPASSPPSTGSTGTGTSSGGGGGTTGGGGTAPAVTVSCSASANTSSAIYWGGPKFTIQINATCSSSNGKKTSQAVIGTTKYEPGNNPDCLSAEDSEGVASWLVPQNVGKALGVSLDSAGAAYNSSILPVIKLNFYDCSGFTSATT